MNNGDDLIDVISVSATIGGVSIGSLSNITAGASGTMTGAASYVAGDLVLNVTGITVVAASFVQNGNTTNGTIVGNTVTFSNVDLLAGNVEIYLN